jgi:hypothetical protein
MVDTTTSDCIPETNSMSTRPTLSRPRPDPTTARHEGTEVERAAMRLIIPMTSDSSRVAGRGVRSPGGAWGPGRPKEVGE